jgi:CRISPR-associated protein Cmr5
MKISQNKVEKALDVLNQWQTHYPKGFPKEMKGDISSFGASIIQAGLLPSVIFFSEGDVSKLSSNTEGGKDADKNTKERRAIVMKMVFEVMEIPEPKPIENETDDEKMAKETEQAQAAKRPLFNYVRKHINKQSEALDKITEAALALKLAFRAFKIDESDSKPKSQTT